MHSKSREKNYEYLILLVDSPFESSKSRTDIKITLGNHPKLIYGNLRITNITSQSYNKTSIASVLKAAASTKSTKHQKFDFVSEFFPMVISTYGNFDKRFIELITLICDTASQFALPAEHFNKRFLYYLFIDTILIKNAMGQALLLQAGADLALQSESKKLEPIQLLELDSY